MFVKVIDHNMRVRFFLRHSVVSSQKTTKVSRPLDCIVFTKDYTTKFVVSRSKASDSKY